MSNFNFPGNNHSLSEPGPNAALPATYPFALTKEFRAAFTEEGGADLPSSYKLAYWWEHTGNAAQQREDECAAECNRLLQADYETAVARIERQNRVRTRRNKRDRGAFQRAIAEFAGAHAAWRRRWEQEQGEWERRQQEQIRREARDALSSAIDGQSEAVALAVTNVVDVTEQERRESGAGRAARWSLWLGFLTIAAPFAGVFATPVFSALAYELRQAANRKARRQLAWRLGNYGKRSVEEQQLAQRASLTSWVTFHLHGCGVREVHDTHLHPGGRFTHYFVESPVAPVKPDRTPDNHDWRNDERPLGVYPDDAFDEPATTGRVAAGLATRAVMWIPFLGLALNGLLSRFDGRRLRAVAAKRVNTNAILAYRRATLAARLEQQLNCPEVMAQLTSQRPAAVPSRAEPKPPAEPTPRPLRPLPAPPVLQTALQISPPADCFDTPEMDDAEHVFKGSQVFALEQVLPLARALLFADDCVRPYFSFGGAPFAVTGNAPHKMIVGTTGSGKTTALLRLMSSPLPLSRAQAQRIADYIASEGAMYPGSSHEWSRSRTHQAVVYNAKGEYLPYLEAFGFDRQVDLFNLDPEDPQGYAWDVAADINDRNSIEKFAEQLVPMNTAASRDRHVEFWLGAARRVIEAIIICLRNAARSAGKEPAWTLRDLVTAASTDDAIRHLLRWHDTPLQKEKELFGLSDAQTSSIMLTLRESLGHFALLANRWHDAKKRGRTISLKAWSKNGAHSVLVLPNTMANISAHGPLNKSVFKALTDLWLSEEYSFSVDGDGRKRPLHRHMFIDEFGHAGRFDDLERIMGEGRAFGVNVVLGLHQLSQAREAYGENGAETIVGLCSYFAFLKSNDLRTQKWMSEVVGNCLRSYEKASFSYSTSQGQTVTASHTTTEGQSHGTSASASQSTTTGASDTNGHAASTSHSQQKSVTSQPGQPSSSTSGASLTTGDTTSQSHTASASESQSSTTGSSEQTSRSVADAASEAFSKSATAGRSMTRELRGEPAIEPHEFRNFADPATAGVCEGVYLTPTLPVFRTKLTLAQMQPEYEFPEKLHQFAVRRDPEADDRASASEEWNREDLLRLCIDLDADDLPPPTIGWSGGTALLSPPEDAAGPADDFHGSFDSGPASDEESEGPKPDNEQPPAADFDF